MEAGQELGLSVVFGIVAFAAAFAVIIHFGKKLTEERQKDRQGTKKETVR